MDEVDKALQALVPTVAKTVPVGTSVLLMDIGDAKRFFPGHDRIRMIRIFTLLGIPLLRDKTRILFNIYTLEKVLNFLTRMGGRGFVLPGSVYKNTTQYVNVREGMAVDEMPLMEITNKEIQQMEDPEIEAERMATGRSNATSRAAYIASLRISKRESEPPKKRGPYKKKDEKEKADNS